MEQGSAFCVLPGLPVICVLEDFGLALFIYKEMEEFFCSKR